MAELVELGASRLHPASNAIEVQAQGPELSPGQAPDYGEIPLIQALGVSARPAPKDENGAAQGVRMEVEGTTGVLVGCTDARSANNYFELGPGETCLHATGQGFDSRVLCKDKLLSIVVGDEMVFSMDLKSGEMSMAYEERGIMISKEQGVVITDGEGASLILKGGTTRVDGKFSAGNRGGIPNYFVLSPSPVIPTGPIVTGTFVVAPGAGYNV